MDLTIQQLRCFIAVAEELHFSRAAGRLHVAVPSLSQQVAALERQLGTSLFHRTSRHVELTVAGHELLPLARRAMHSVAEVLAWADERRATGPRLRLGLVESSPLCSAILAEAARAMPEARFELRHLALPEALDSLTSGSVDVVMLPELETPSISGLRAVPLWSEGRALAVSATHRLASRDAVGISETNDERFVGVHGSEADRRRWFVAPRPRGPVPRVDPVARYVGEVMDMCAAGLGVGITGTTAAYSYARPTLTYVPIPDIPDSITYMLRPAATTVAAMPQFERLAVRVAQRDAERYGARPVTDPAVAV